MKDFAPEESEQVKQRWAEQQNKAESPEPALVTPGAPDFGDRGPFRRPFRITGIDQCFDSSWAAPPPRPLPSTGRAPRPRTGKASDGRPAQARSRCHGGGYRWPSWGLAVVVGGLVVVSLASDDSVRSRARSRPRRRPAN